MTDIVIAGRIESAVTHLAGLGLAAVADAAGHHGVRLAWTDDDDPRFIISFPRAGDDEVAVLLKRHADAMAAPEAWTQIVVKHEGRPETGLFSPRLKAPSTRASWNSLALERQFALDGLVGTGDSLSLEMIGALGEPAYWRFEPREARPDHGASRWEMKTRNKGEEFIGNRFARMARSCGERSGRELLAGITGALQQDELDGTAVSRTATGLQRPGPIDAALAWVALWGLTSFPVVHESQAISRTAAAFPQDVLHPRWFVVPIVNRPASLERYRSLIASNALAVLGRDIAGSQSATVFDRAASAELMELGTVALGIAKVDRRGSDSAPERMILDVEVHPLGQDA